MLVEPDGTPRDLEPPLDRKVASPVGDDDVPSFGERGDDRGDAREGLSVDDCRGQLEELG